MTLDGGNIELGPYGQVMLCDKIFKENPDKTKSQIIVQIEEAFETDEVIILETDPADIVGHIDGCARFIDDERVLLNDFGNPNSTFTKRQKVTLERNGFEVILIPCYRNLPKNKWDASGCYVNFVRVGGLVLFPIYNLATDDLAIEVVTNVFGKRIVPLDCSEIAREGGALNCVTWGN